MTWNVFHQRGREGDAAALLTPGLGCGEGGNRPWVFVYGQPRGTSLLWVAPCIPLLVLPWGQLNSRAFLSLLLLPVPQVSHLLLSEAFWLSLDSVMAAGLPMSSFPHRGASYEELLCCFLRDFGEILANSRNSNTEHASSATLDHQAVAILKVMPEREACEFFIGARCQRMGSAKGL